MRDQYKILAEKYNLIQESYSGYLGTLKDYKGSSLEEAITDILHLSNHEADMFVKWIDTDLKVNEYGFHPQGESAAEVYSQIVGVQGEEEGLVDSSLSFHSRNDERLIMTRVIKDWYRKFYPFIKKLRKQMTQQNKETGINLDI